MTSPTISRLKALFPFLLIYTFLGFISGNLRFYSGEGIQIISGMSWKIGAVLILLCWIIRKMSDKLDSSALDHKSYFIRFCWASILGFVVLLISDFVTRRFLFYPNAGVRSEIIFVGIIALLLLHFCHSQSLLAFNEAVLFFCQLLLTILFIQYADGRLLFSDDHPSFLYRLSLLRRHFPYLPFYNIDWNAGYSAREFFATGTLNIFFVTWPFLYFFSDLTSIEDAKYYVYFIPYIFIFMVPWSVYWAGRLFGLEKRGALLGAFFALGPSLGYFEWVLKFGTIGFAFSAGLVPLTLALTHRLVCREPQLSWRQLLFFLVVSSCCLAWTLSFLAFVPITFFAVWNARTTFSCHRLPKIAVFVVLFFSCNGPWMITFVRESRLLEFLSYNSLPGSHPEGMVQDVPPAQVEKMPGMTQKTVSVNAQIPEPPQASKSLEKKLSRIHKKFKSVFSNTNPLLLLFFLPGLTLVTDKKARYILAVTIGWLILVAVIGDNAKPQLELRRMTIPGSFLMAILAGAGVMSFLDYLWRETRGLISLQKFGYGSAMVFLMGGVFISPLVIGSIYLNRSDNKYMFSTPVVEKLSKAITQYGGAGRTFFLGFLLHELSSSVEGAQNGGHVAPLASFTGHSLYAVGYYHTHWSSTDPVPKGYLKRGRAGVEEFLDLVNTSAVVTFRPEWTQYCLSAEATNYHHVFQDGQFHLFTRDSVTTTAGYFLQGAGEIQRSEEGITVFPQTEESVIKFRYFPRLRGNFSSIADGSIFPVRVFEEEIGEGKVADVNFIGLHVSRKVIEEKRGISIGYRG